MNVRTAQPPKKRKSQKILSNMDLGIMEQFLNGIQWFFGRQEKEISLGEKIALISVIAVFDTKEVVTKQDIIRVNKAKADTIYANLRNLEKKGYIQSTRSNQFYSLSYITLTDKGNLFASRLRRILQGV